MANNNSFPLISYQPFRLFFQLAYAFTIVARLPYWLTISLIPRLRPHASWSAKQTFMTRLARAAVDMSSRIGITERLTLNKGREGDRFHVIPAAGATLYRGPLVSDVVKPAPVGGVWTPQAPDSQVDGFVIFYIHGGAFILGDGRDLQSAFTTSCFIKQTGAKAVFSLQYRLSGHADENPFPAALQDAVTAYSSLVKTIDPKKLAVVGDSAGGNLIIALLRYIEEFGAEIDLPRPVCAGLLSPWVAPMDSSNAAQKPRQDIDYLPQSFVKRGSRCYTALTPSTNPYITPLGSPFATPVPIFINAGALERLYTTIVRFKEEMIGVEGNQIEFAVEKDAVHDTLLTGATLGFEESARSVAERMGTFVRESVSGS